jgi:hypothetical protein
VPASSAMTQQRLGWRPAALPGLIADLDSGAAFEAGIASSSPAAHLP